MSRSVHRKRPGNVWIIGATTLLMGYLLYESATRDDIMGTEAQEILLQWRVEGGLQPSPEQRPDLTVYTDGHVEVGPRFTGGKVLQGRLSETELNTLRRFVVEEQNIWAIEPSEIEHQKSATIERRLVRKQDDKGVTPLGTDAIVDAGTTVIQVWDGNRQKQISYYNLVGDADEYREIDELRRLRAIERRLIDLAQQLASTTQ